VPLKRAGLRRAAPDDARHYADPLPNNRGIPTVPAKRQLSIARLRYCE
jgi:hypothetical protein